MPGAIKGALAIIALFLILSFLWGCSIGIADLIVNG